ncbi:type II toxin-antitoxin system antitoxin SocA domain-containing protein [Companilactobacillus jidongensis]|uniref:type II toxin-antitoxin system antitoxin SocA domain-containing protein n=1 Tax=Companilactobacillus jidongensis TaxID=2486006 RepID=UPI000F79FE06|nr:type II toxin-antitoxin system antitoxin SocA domain-containing protein [Companilactobacillus jidongensis]
MIKTKEYFFNDKKELVSYIYNALSNPTPIKLQKTLYFLWAFYAATYGNIDYNVASEFKEEEVYPKYLFDAQFEAWKYGPVDNDVYSWNKSDSIENFDNSFVPKTVQDKEIKLFMDDIISQVDNVNDFGLVERSHKDQAYKNVYNPNELPTDMDYNQIKKDYISYVEQQSKI